MKITATYAGPIDTFPKGQIEITILQLKNRSILVKVTEKTTMEYGNIYEFIKDWKNVTAE